MKNRMRRGAWMSLAAAALAILEPRAAHATGTDRGLISDITIEGTNFARVALNINPNFGGARPACHNAAYTVHYAFDTSTTKGKSLLSALQSAQLAGKLVTITGANSCTSTGVATLETLASLTVWTS